jgi:hypothetical protein
MRFRPTQTNLVIDLDTDDASDTVRAIVRYFVPRYAKKVYFLSDQPAEWCGSGDGLSRVVEGQEPSNFIRSCRVVQRGFELFVVSPHDSRAGKEQWRALARELAAGAA